MNKYLDIQVYSMTLSKLSALFFILVMTGCAAYGSRLHTDFVPAGSLRLAQVNEVANRAGIVQFKEMYNAIIASGIKDSEIIDGSIVAARIFCCGGISESSSAEKTNARFIFVPKGINVALGDVVEYTVGRNPVNGDGGQLNTVTRVVWEFKTADKSCWWDPKDGRLWLRTLYCDWMPMEGWVKQGGISPAWYHAPKSVILEKYESGL